jgi:hypothetical protein
MSTRSAARALRPKQLRVGQVLRHTIYDTRWLVLARELGGNHPYRDVRPDYSKRLGVLLRYVDAELGLGDVLQPRQLRRVVDRSLVPLAEQQDLDVRFSRQVRDEPWEVFEAAIGTSLVSYWELLPDAPCPVAPELMLERARRARMAADILERLMGQIGGAAAALRELGEQLPQDELHVVEDAREGEEPNHYTHVCSPDCWGIGSHSMQCRINDLGRQAAQLDEWRRARVRRASAGEEGTPR